MFVVTKGTRNEFFTSLSSVDDKGLRGSLSHWLQSLPFAAVSWEMPVTDPYAPRPLPPPSLSDVNQCYQ
jgi:hypothetical protein